MNTDVINSLWEVLNKSLLIYLEGESTEKHKIILLYFQHMPSNLHNTQNLQVPEATAN